MQRQDQLWYHAVWGTKHRKEVLQSGHFRTISAICTEREDKWQFHLDTMNGTADHVHILIQIHPDRPVSKVVGWIKGSTSHYFGQGFEWQSGYVIQTVSPSDLEEIRQYIRQQVNLHARGQTNPDWELPD